MKKILLLAFLLGGICGCNINGDIDFTNTDLSGNWNWVSTDGGIAFHIHETPESTGKTIQLKLDNNFKFEIFENGVKTLDGSYTISLEKSIYSVEKENYLSLSKTYQNSNAVLNGIVKLISTDTLTISDNAHDGIGSGFVRQ